MQSAFTFAIDSLIIDFTLYGSKSIILSPMGDIVFLLEFCAITDRRKLQVRMSPISILVKIAFVILRTD